MALSLNFNRTLGRHLAHRLSGTPITPNMLTAMSLTAGCSSALAMSRGSLRSMLAGAVLLHASFILDCSDGELARLTSRHSAFGKWFDVFSDLIIEVALWTGLVLACIKDAGNAPFFWYAAACVASLMNFMLVLAERKKNVSFHSADAAATGKKSLFFRILESLAHNGVSIVLVYVGVLFVEASQFLVGAAVFVSAIWITRLTANAKALVLG